MSGDDAEHSGYQYVCPVCNADSGDITFENPQRACESAPENVECANCGTEVTPAVVDRSVREGVDHPTEESDDE